MVVKKTPRPHQRQAVNDVTAAFENGAERGILSMACGTGKTLTALWIVETLSPETLLVVIPSLALLSEFLSEWRTQSGLPFDYLVVCSDDDVTEEYSDGIVINDDSTFVTTDPIRIANFLEGGGERRYVFSTYHSIHRISQALEVIPEISFDMVVADEAHRCAGRHEAHFTMLLDCTAIRAQRRLFVTATPRIYAEKDAAAFSMDNEAHFGKVMHVLPFRKAIQDGLLCDYKVVVVGIRPSELPWLQLDDPRYDTILKQVALLRGIHDCNITRLLTFHSTIERMVDFVSDLDERVAPRALGAVGSSKRTLTTIVTGHMPMSYRLEQLRELAEPPPNVCRTIANCSCLSEGIDVPSLDGIAYVDPKSSVISIVQSLGRVMRLDENKVLGTVIIPVIVPEDADPETVIRHNSFGTVWHVMEALRSCDDEFKAVVDRLREGSGEVEEEEPLFGSASSLGAVYAVPGYAGVNIDVAETIAVNSHPRGGTTPRIEFCLPFRDDIPAIMRAMYSRFMSFEREYPFEGDTPEGATRRWGEAYYAVHGKWPGRRSGIVAEFPTLSWRLLDDWMRDGRNGFQAGGSLITFFGVNYLPDLEVAEVQQWVANYVAIHGVPPPTDDTVVPECPGMTWRNLNKCLRLGRRGLPGGMTLRMLANPGSTEPIKRVRPTMAVGAMAKEIIRGYISETGKRPLSTSADEIESIKPEYNVTWRQLSERINSAGFDGRKVTFSQLVGEVVAELGVEVEVARGNRFTRRETEAA